jgi:hypothetical protein
MTWRDWRLGLVAVLLGQMLLGPVAGAFGLFSPVQRALVHQWTHAQQVAHRHAQATFAAESEAAAQAAVAGAAVWTAHFSDPLLALDEAAEPSPPWHHHATDAGLQPPALLPGAAAPWARLPAQAVLAGAERLPPSVPHPPPLRPPRLA